LNNACQSFEQLRDLLQSFEQAVQSFEQVLNRFWHSLFKVLNRTDGLI